MTDYICVSQVNLVTSRIEVRIKRPTISKHRIYRNTSLKLPWATGSSPPGSDGPYGLLIEAHEI